MTTPRRELSGAEVRRTLDRAYERLADKVASNHRQKRLFEAAAVEAEREEREHRKLDWSNNPRSYRQTVGRAARYWVLRALRKPRRIESAIDAAECPLSRLYGAALASLLSAEDQAYIFEDPGGFDAIGYSAHIAPPTEKGQ